MNLNQHSIFFVHNKERFFVVIMMTMMESSATIQRTMHALRIHLQDLENEIESTESMLEHLEHERVHHTSKLKVLAQRRSEKENLLRTFQQIHSFRQEEIHHDHTLRQKVMYSIRCSDYLRRHSNYAYKENELLMDELIEYAHKLHLIRSLPEWIHLQPNDVLTCPLEYPHDEQEYYRFELTHSKDECHIALGSLPLHSIWSPICTLPSSSSSLPSPSWTHIYAIPHDHWHALYEYNNDVAFSIDTNASALSHIVRRIPLTSSSVDSQTHL